MHIHAFQHVPFEDIGSMLQDVTRQGHSLTTTHWYRGDQPPALADVDLLIVMGGPMGIYDEAEFPWLADEKAYLKQAIAAGKKIIGICLGAQLLADVLGGPVSRNTHREIGWFPLMAAPGAENHPLTRLLVDIPAVFHWHGDTFAIPEGALWLATSQACAHQAFVMDNRLFGFQFHLETTEASAQALLTHCAGDLDNSPFVQEAGSIMADNARFTAINHAMSRVWDWMLAA